MPDDFTGADADDLARVLKALADPIRLRLVSLIGSHPDGTVSVLQLAKAFDVTGPTLSHHLRILREAGLVNADRRGTWIYYGLRADSLAEISAILDRAYLRETATVTAGT
jgi:ArsR family transcriptional regulator